MSFVKRASTSFLRLGPDDLRETAELEAACFSLPWTSAQLAAAFMQKHFIAFGLKAFLCQGSVGQRQPWPDSKKSPVTRTDKISRTDTGTLPGQLVPDNAEQLASGVAEQLAASRQGQHELRLLAYISMYHNADELEILNLAVLPAQRRQGHGQELVRQSLTRAVKLGIKRAVLEVRSGNTAALALYARTGFRQIGLRKAYYADTEEDALVLECALPPAKIRCQSF